LTTPESDSHSVNSNAIKHDNEIGTVAPCTSIKINDLHYVTPK